MINPATIEEIKSRMDIVEVVGDFVIGFSHYKNCLP